MISRIWRGWTTRENADAYESLVQNEVFKGIEAMNISGLQGIHLLRRSVPDGVEFATIMWFASLEDVRAFQGEDYEQAYVPKEARRLLARYDERSAHYDVIAAPESGKGSAS